MILSFFQSFKETKLNRRWKDVNICARPPPVLLANKFGGRPSTCQLKSITSVSALKRINESLPVYMKLKTMVPKR